MNEHFTESTEYTMGWCNTCKRETRWTVSAGRLGHCTQHEAQYETKAQVRRRLAREKAKRQLRLPLKWD